MKDREVKKPASLAILEKVEEYSEKAIKINKIQPEESAFDIAADTLRIYDLLAEVFIETLKESEIPEEFEDEITGRLSKVMALITEEASLERLKKSLKQLRTNLESRHICGKCGKTSEILPTENPNFRCPACGYETQLLLRRELVDLDDPVEGPIALKIAGISLRKEN
ncbi:hypothetical protein KJ866_04260 [Patescibacteria group bacterium]|nr:hypothetical protein [Patescibacteria group bacterium]MBU2219844.1 hypothetical protein [Patescibacteria group bacterium]MBU2264901.1 hypothetical protein [Patescibacteria group bacterium]